MSRKQTIDLTPEALMKRFRRTSTALLERMRAEAIEDVKFMRSIYETDGDLDRFSEEFKQSAFREQKKLERFKRVLDDCLVERTIAALDTWAKKQDAPPLKKRKKPL